MKQQTATASRVVHAPAEQVYSLIADYRNGHPRILPRQHFLSLQVEEGGYGAGTIISFEMRLLGQTRRFRSLITEPEPRRLLVETDIQSETPTSFRVAPVGDGTRSRVTIATVIKSRNPVEALLAKFMLQRVYREELELLAGLAEKQASVSSPPAGTNSPPR